MLRLKIVTPARTIYDNEILQVTIPTLEGEITVLQNHIPLISVLSAGDLVIKDTNEEHHIAVAGGFLEVRGSNEVVILSDFADRAQDIDEEKAESARKKAQDEMEKIKGTENVDFAKLQAIIDREMNKLKIARKYKNLPPIK